MDKHRDAESADDLSGVEKTERTEYVEDVGCGGGAKRTEKTERTEQAERTLSNTYRDTRGLVREPLTFTQAIVAGIAEGGGLLVPNTIPHLTLEEIVALGNLPYAQQAAFIYQRFGVDVPAQRVEALMEAAYGENFDDERVAPVVTVAPKTHVLELWHGPTAAFKDMALQCLPLFFSEALEGSKRDGVDKGDGSKLSTFSKRAFASTAAVKKVDNLEPSPLSTPGQPEPSPSTDYLILVATSGDTGKAALEGFADRPHTNILVFYPHGGVSDIQLLQMATQRGDNVGVFGVKGNFDDCQTAVKGAFDDAVFNEWLASRHNMRLSSANSINWGRLLPQIVYYVSAYAQLVANGSLKCGETFDVCVPTGNFGNILAAWYARQMGTPIEQLYCASNENRVLTDFINTGTYDIAERAFTLTPSPSMDILVSSNLERQLFELSGRKSSSIRSWMEQLRTERRFTVDRQTFAALRAVFAADWVSNDESLETIREVYQEHGYLLDPHTAVAWKVASRLRAPDDRPVLVVATAHWAKFAADVYRALASIPAGAALPREISALRGTELNELLVEKTGSGPLPARLAELESLPLRFSELVEGSVAGIEGACSRYLERLM
ncbi:MAG: threonine synthase [Coriobacteriales bacterium]|jgi:threonine synthase|nr:threonine synthase [Coriobacteriales bacterium]